jgi:hypothetical protein
MREYVHVGVRGAVYFKESLHHVQQHENNTGSCHKAEAGIVFMLL